MDYEALSHMTVIQLREEAKKVEDVKGVSAMKKDELIALLAERHGLEIPAKAPKKKHIPTVRNKKTLRDAITKLRTEQDAARDKKDRKKVNELRRRIHSLKRAMRWVD